MGKQKALLQNVLLKTSLWINKAFASVIRNCENNRPFDLVDFSFLGILAEKGWGTISDKPIFIDKLRLYNVFSDKKFFKETPIINSAVLQITNKFPIVDGKPYCDSFCPAYIKIESEDSLSVDEWENTVLNLKKYGCTSIILTGGEVFCAVHLREIFKFIRCQGMNLSINTTGLVPVETMGKDIGLTVACINVENLKVIMNNLRKCNLVTLLIESSARINRLSLPPHWKVIRVNYKMPQITKNTLTNMDLNNFSMRLRKNKCLYGKVSILNNGDVYPCLEAYKSSETLVGNITQSSWSSIMKKLIETHWLNKIDEHEICSECEFRYACNSCPFCNVAESCCYDLEVGVWK
jgi:radical SAM protein with 4Fe4S-binding SPASM domain